MLKLKLSLLLLVLLCCSFSVYSQENEPLTAEELSILPRELLIQMLINSDTALIQTGEELKKIEIAWKTEQELLKSDRVLLTADLKRQEQQETSLEMREATIVSLSKSIEAERIKHLTDKIAIGLVSAGVAVLVTLLIVN